MNLTAAVHARLAGDATLAAMLAKYDGAPAVFTTDPPPDDAALPYIVVPGDLAQNPFDTKDLRGREIYRDVRCYTPATGSSKLVDDIAERTRFLLHRHRLVVDGVPVMLARVTGPRAAAAEEQSYGRLLTLYVKTDLSGTP